MTRTLRTVVLATALSLVACSEPEAQGVPEKQLSAHPAAERAKEQQKLAKANHLLTTVSPPAPHTIAAELREPKPAELANDTQADQHTKDQQTQEQQKSLALEGHQDEPDEFDRPLDPTEVQVVRFVLARDVKGREPVGESDYFPTGKEKIFAFVQLANEQGAPYALRVHFEPAEGPSTPYGVKLTVPTAPRHRTWAFTRVERAPGRYKAVLRTLDGQEIASREFVIEALPGDIEKQAE